jgi:hypothetical protein
MGRRGGTQAALNREEQLWKARELLYAAAPQAAGLLADMVNGNRKASSVEIQAATSILDRTIGKVRLEVDASGSELAAQLVRDLASDEPLSPSSDDPS